jgi:hypothetical protein
MCKFAARISEWMVTIELSKTFEDLKLLSSDVIKRLPHTRTDIVVEDIDALDWV